MDRETARLRLLVWNHAKYGDSYAQILKDPVAMQFISGGESLSREVSDEISTRSEWLWDEGFGPWAAILKNGNKFVGRIGLSRLDDWPGQDRVEVGFELDRRNWNQGLATEGAQEAIRFVVETVGLEVIISVTTPRNAASMRVIEKCGLRRKGQKQFRDTHVVWYAIARAEWPSAQ